MVSIVTGKIDSGKTTRLLENYQRTKKGDGIVSIKRMSGTDVLGFDAMVLSDEKTRPYLVHKRHLKPTNLPLYVEHIGPYLILKDTKAFIDRFYEMAIAKHVSPIYFDEVGQLEIAGHGFGPWLKLALEEQLDIVMTVRSDLVESIIKTYQIQTYQILSR